MMLRDDGGSCVGSRRFGLSDLMICLSADASRLRAGSIGSEVGVCFEFCVRLKKRHQKIFTWTW
jgi:hypothetical protein